MSQTRLGGFTAPGRGDLKRSSPTRFGLAATVGRGVCFPFIGNVFKASAARQWPVGAGAGSGAEGPATKRHDTGRRPTVQQAPARACGQGSRPHGEGRGRVACQAVERRRELEGGEEGARSFPSPLQEKSPRSQSEGGLQKNANVHGAERQNDEQKTVRRPSPKAG